MPNFTCSVMCKKVKVFSKNAKHHLIYSLIYYYSAEKYIISAGI